MCRVRLQDDLVLVIMAEPIWVFAIARVGRPPARLDIGRPPVLGTKGAQHGGWMQGASAHLQVIGLQDGAALAGPIGLQP